SAALERPGRGAAPAPGTVQALNDSQVPVKHVYRVLQCQEEELTQTVSTMAGNLNSWSVLVLPISMEMKIRLNLCVVSKELHNTPYGTTSEPSGKAKILQERGSRM
uniref:Uncharacterized protein n=1 Tax=Chrysemys picta bellii TaxID=8478 RepID=A0A8C3FHI9_CHRPI